MSITIGIYDLFAFTIPGLLYLFVINEFFRAVGWQSFQFYQMKDGHYFFYAVIAFTSAYLIGHLFDPVANWLCFHLLTRYKVKQACLSRLKERHPELEIKFDIHDCDALFVILRQRHLEYSHVLDSFMANNMLLRNICLGLLLLATLYIRAIILDFHWISLMIILGLLVLSWNALHRSRMYYSWFFSDLFSASLEYGTSLKEVVEYDRERDNLKQGKRKTNVRSTPDRTRKATAKQAISSR